MIEVNAERSVAAPAERVYEAIADMNQHARFLPAAFSDFRIEEGGRGAGTVTSFKVNAGGRVLTESDLGSSLVTTFTVDPEAAGCRVRIATAWEGAGGVGGFFERLFAPRVMRRIYAEELERLADYVRAPLDG